MRLSLPLISLTFVATLFIVLGSSVGARQGVTPGYDLEFSEFLQSQGARVGPSVVAVETRFSRHVHDNGRLREIMVAGDFSSGFIYNDEGIVVTDYRTIVHPPSTYFARTAGASDTTADYIMVKLADGRTYEAEIVGLDKTSSLAVLRLPFIEPVDSIPAPLGDSNDVIVGEPILYIGYNTRTGARISYDFGVISALRPKFPTIEESTNQYFQVNVPQNSGNQGGVVVNSQGEVVALMTHITPYRDATEIHFALPIQQAIDVIDAILDEGEMHRPWLGFHLLEMNPQIERAYSLIEDMDGDGLVTDSDRDLFELEVGIDLRNCLFVIWVDEDSPMGDSGILEADILLEFNGVPVTNMDELKNQIERYDIGDRITIEWMRREYAVWDPYVAEIEIEYSGQREEEE